MTIPYILLANGNVGRRFLAHAIDTGHPPIEVVLNAPARQRLGDELRRLAEQAAIPVAAWDAAVVERLRDMLRSSLTPWLLSVYFGHILRDDLLEAAGGRSVNVHPALLPWGRGAHTNVWAIVDGEPAGVTLHVITAGVDEGPILAQREVIVQPYDTAATLHQRLEEAAFELLVDQWPEGVRAAHPGSSQGPGGSVHRVADFATLNEYDLNKDPAARRFFNLLRARSFPPYGGLRVRYGKMLIEVQLTLKECTETDDGN
jgi:methionyl-tRNA formyltransferase